MRGVTVDAADSAINSGTLPRSDASATALPRVSSRLWRLRP